MFNSILKLLLVAFVEIISIFFPNKSPSEGTSNNDSLLDATKLLLGDEVYSTDPKYMANPSSAYWNGDNY